MEERYTLLAKAGVRHVSSYNQLGEQELIDRIQPETDEERDNIPRHLPYVVIIADEMADLMMTSAKEVEGHIIRLAQKSRAVGIHLVLATQKPTVDVITGLIKSNLPARIAFQVASRTDSRVVLDEMGADKLLGNGDMLFLWPGTSTLLRGQGTFLSDDEITKVVDSVATNDPQFVRELVQLQPANSEESAASENKNKDALYDSAVDVVIGEGRGSVSLLQRCLGIGYGRAARLVDFMAEDGIVGPYNGSQAREVLVTAEQWATMSSGESDNPERAGTVHLAESSTTEIDDDEEGVYAELQDNNDALEEQIEEEIEEEEQAEYEEDEYEEEYEEEEECEEDEAGYEESEDDIEEQAVQDEDEEWEEELEEDELSSDEEAAAEEEEEYEEEEYEDDEWEEDEYEEEQSYEEEKV
jgi:S-DNA-T family DNA segregation ATPase FtsK/SpoIIIE